MSTRTLSMDDMFSEFLQEVDSSKQLVLPSAQATAPPQKAVHTYSMARSVSSTPSSKSESSAIVDLVFELLSYQPPATNANATLFWKDIKESVLIVRAITISSNRILGDIATQLMNLKHQWRAFGTFWSESDLKRAKETFAMIQKTHNQLRQQAEQCRTQLRKTKTRLEELSLNNIFPGDKYIESLVNIEVELREERNKLWNLLRPQEPSNSAKLQLEARKKREKAQYMNNQLVTFRAEVERSRKRMNQTLDSQLQRLQSRIDGFDHDIPTQMSRLSMESSRNRDSAQTHLEKAASRQQTRTSFTQSLQSSVNSATVRIPADVTSKSKGSSGKP